MEYVVINCVKVLWLFFQEKVFFCQNNDACLVRLCCMDAGMPYDCINAFDRCLLRFQQSPKNLGP